MTEPLDKTTLPGTDGAQPVMVNTSEGITPTIGGVLGKIPSGLFIVSIHTNDGRQTALLASWVQQASFDPPMLTVAVNARRYHAEWLSLAGTAVGISVIAEGQKEFLRHFGSGFEPGEAAFEGIPTKTGKTGALLLTGSLGSLEGYVVSHMTTGDHIVFAIELVSAQVHAGKNLTPWTHIRRNGLKY